MVMESSDNNKNVVLGYFGRNLPELDNKGSIDFSILGGTPAWQNSVLPPKFPFHCKNCGLQLTFFCQLFTTYNPNFKRIVYIFACGQSSDCVNKKHNWIVLRCKIKSNFAQKRFLFENQDDDCQISNFSFKFNDNWMECASNFLSDIENKNESDSVESFNPSLNLKKRSLDCIKLPSFLINTIDEYSVINSNMAGSSFLDLRVEELKQEFDSRNSSMDYIEDDRKDLQSISGDGAWLNEAFERDTNDPSIKFSSKLSVFPSQVIRYCFDGKPMWLTNLEEKIKEYQDDLTCDYCGKKRVFEFQILSSLILQLEERSKKKINFSSNWGTVLIFSCEGDCEKPDRERNGVIYSFELAIPIPLI